LALKISPFSFPISACSVRGAIVARLRQGDYSEFMTTVSADDASRRLPDLLAEVEFTGETIVICRDSVPVAELRPVAAAKGPFRTNPRLAGVVFVEDPTKPLEC
jgi:antitoxin (DNA-binding transcriptional repressor) of toxin-antitoxin stability system